MSARVIDSGLLETAGEVEGEGVRVRGLRVVVRRALLSEGVARERAELPQGVVRLGEAAGELLDVARFVVERGCGDVGVSGVGAVGRVARGGRCGAGIAGLRDAIRCDAGNGAILGIFCRRGWVVGCLAGREADDAVAREPAEQETHDADQAQDGPDGEANQYHVRAVAHELLSQH